MRSQTVVLPLAVPPHTPMTNGSRVPGGGAGEPGVPTPCAPGVPCAPAAPAKQRAGASEACAVLGSEGCRPLCATQSAPDAPAKVLVARHRGARPPGANRATKPCRRVAQRSREPAVATSGACCDCASRAPSEARTRAQLKAQHAARHGVGVQRSHRLRRAWGRRMVLVRRARPRGLRAPQRPVDGHRVAHRGDAHGPGRGPVRAPLSPRPPQGHVRSRHP